MLDPLNLTCELIDLPSVSGQEGPVVDRLAELCRGIGLQVRLQEVEPGRANLLATFGEPRVLLCTHTDTVPPHVAATQNGTWIHGRGACDAKGIAAAMLAAAERLVRAGTNGFGLLLVVAEETDSLGAKRANAELALPVRHLIVGEPTDNRLAVAQKGILTAHVRCTGEAAHGAYPEAGRSAIRALVEVLADLYGADWGRSPELGENVLNVGRIAGGVAANVLAPEASADVQIRVATSVGLVEKRLQRLIAARADIDVSQRAEPLRLGRLPGFETTVAGFGTDLPYLDRFGQRYLLGPGSILDAHTPHERVRKADVLAAVEQYARLVTTLLEAPAV